MRKTKIRKVRRTLLNVIFLSFILVVCIHWYRVRNMMPSPIDHLRSNVLKPFYKMQVGLTRFGQESRLCFQANDKLIRFLLMFDHPLQCPTVREDTTCALPKLIVISARPLEERMTALNSWTSHNVIVYNTTGRSSRVWALLRQLFTIYEARFPLCIIPIWFCYLRLNFSITQVFLSVKVRRGSVA